MGFLHKAVGDALPASSFLARMAYVFVVQQRPPCAAPLCFPALPCMQCMCFACLVMCAVNARKLVAAGQADPSLNSKAGIAGACQDQLDITHIL